MKRFKIGFALTAVLLILIAVLWSRSSFGPAAPEQPIAFSHAQHVTKADGPQLACVDCHSNADKSPHATVPSVQYCMGCHSGVMTESPEVQKLTKIADAGQEPQWARVIWIEPEAAVFFTHKPHIKAQLDCTACHGQVAEMQTVEREINPTMGWCIDCHVERKVSIDCYICHR